MAVIAAIIGPSDSTRRLGEIGAVVVADLLLALERRFDIGLDADEVLPNGTVGVLLGLVELRAEAAQAAAMASKVYHWDDERAQRGRPLFVPRPQLAATSEPDASLAPPPWPSVEPEFTSPDCAGYSKPHRRIEIAVPSDEAWALAEKLYDRERARRAHFLILALGCVVVGVLGLIAWAVAAGHA